MHMSLNVLICVPLIHFNNAVDISSPNDYEDLKLILAIFLKMANTFSNNFLFKYMYIFLFAF